MRLAKALCELEESQFANVLDHEVLYAEPLGIQVNTDNGIRGALNEKLHGLGVQFIAVDTNVEPELLGYITRGTTRNNDGGNLLAHSLPTLVGKRSRP